MAACHRLVIIIKMKAKMNVRVGGGAMLTPRLMGREEAQQGGTVGRRGARREEAEARACVRAWDFVRGCGCASDHGARAARTARLHGSSTAAAGRES